MEINSVNQQNSGVIRQNNTAAKSEPQSLHCEDKFESVTNDNAPSGLNKLAGKLLNKAERLKTVWTADLDYYSYSEPALTENGMLIKTNQHGTVFCIDSKTGERKWKYEAGGGSGLPPSAGKDGRVYVPTAKGKLLCLDEKTGEKKWETQLKHYLIDNIVAGKDNCLFCADEYTAVALDAQTGDKLWEKNDVNYKDHPLTLSDGTVCFHGSMGNLYAFDGKSGNPKWKSEFDGMFSSPPAVSKDNDIYFVGPMSKFYGINGKTGEIKFTCEAGGVIDAPAISPDGEKAYLIGRQNRIDAVDLKTGKKLWETQCGDFPQKIAAGIDGSAYVGFRDGTIKALDGKSGNQKWEYTENKDKGMSGLITGADGTIYYSDTSGKLFALKDALIDPDSFKISKDTQAGEPENGNGNKNEIEEEKNPSIKRGKDFVDIGGVKLPVRKKTDYRNI